MNYLSRSLLAGSSGDKIFGSFLGNNIKSNTYHKYNHEMLQGIQLAKIIDQYTMTHPCFNDSAQRLNPRFRKFAKPLIYLFYDHFLAAGWDQYSQEPLKKHSANIYKILSSRSEILPYKISRIFPLMEKTDWLSIQVDLKGTYACIGDMIRLGMLSSHQEYAFADLMEKYYLYKKDFSFFYPQLVEFVNSNDITSFFMKKENRRELNMQRSA